MPCHTALCYSAALNETETREDGVKMHTWRAVRRQHLKNLRKQTRQVVMFSAILCSLKVGVLDMVFPGKQGFAPRGSEDYGIAYTIGSVMSWLYLCLFAIVYQSFFSWWVTTSLDEPKDSASPSTAEKIASKLQQVDFILFTVLIGTSLLQHAFHTICAVIYVDARPVDRPFALPASNKKNWLVRMLLITGIAFTMVSGYGCFQILESYDLARVKDIEYYTIVMPIQVNLGIALGSAIQLVAEKRASSKLRKMAVKDVESAKLDEKINLLG